MLWLLEVDPNSVRAGWLPLLIVVGIFLIIVGLYFSMRREIGKIDVPTRAELAEERAAERRSHEVQSLDDHGNPLVDVEPGRPADRRNP